MTHDETIWLAGWLEGEGCFTKKNTSCIQIIGYSTDKDVIEKVAAIMGSTGIYTQADNGPLATKPIHKTFVYAAKAQNIMEAIRPYMSTRRGQKIDELLEGRRQMLVNRPRQQSNAGKAAWATAEVRERTLNGIRNFWADPIKKAEVLRRRTQKKSTN